MSEHSAAGAATTPPASGSELASSIEASLVRALERLRECRPFAKATALPPVLELARRLLVQADGVTRLYALAPQLDEAGLFSGSDWAQPQTLLPSLSGKTLEAGERNSVVIECVSLLRILAIANQAYFHSGFSSEQARHFLTQVLAHNLSRVFPASQSEAERIRQADLNPAIDQLFQFVVSHIGYEDILGSLSDEIWRILGERPIQVGHVKSMITQIAITLSQNEGTVGDKRLGVERLISALFGPTQGCLDDPGLEAYQQRLASMDQNGLLQEAHGFARAMHDVGLVSDYHAVYLRWLLENDRQELISDALGLSSTGLECLRCYSELIQRLITEAVFPQTAQSVYGLTMMLERGILYMPAIGPGLWRQIGLQLSQQSAQVLADVYGPALPPRVFLLAGVLSVLGQPLGVGQGNNPTCQAARAVSMWALNDPDYLLYLIAQVARFDSILMHFEGAAIHSAELPGGLLRSVPLDTAPVSTLLVPHLDRVYNQMGVLCADRGEDPHCWINPEFHGWWVGREFSIAVDVQTGKLKNYDLFLRRFFASYHPFYNGGQPVIHPQPAGLAITDSAARFVGWHAITLLRVALDQAGEMRVYFYNPNNDSGQHWGGDVIVSTQHNGERYGEASLPFNQLASRLYIFHGEPFARPDTDAVPAQDLAQARDMALASWAVERVPEIVD